MIAIDLSKQQELDADQKVIQHINCTWTLDAANNRIILFVVA